MSAEFLPHLRAENACIEQFLSVLDREEEAMTSGRFTEMAPLTAQKAGLLDAMTTLDREREAMQKALGFEPGRAGADAAAAAQGEETAEAWANLLVLAGVARMRNRSTGSLVFTHLDFTQRAIHFLQGGAQPYYGPDGITRAAGGVPMRLALV